MEDPKLRIIRNLKNPNNNRKKPKNLKKGLSLETDDPNKKNPNKNKRVFHFKLKHLICICANDRDKTLKNDLLRM